MDDIEITSEALNESANAFYASAPGLADLIATTVDENVLATNVICSKAAAPKVGIMMRPKFLPQTPGKLRNTNAENESDEENTNEVDIGSKMLRRPGRAAALKAANKISDQLAKENTLLN